jgi:hypothetical protein
MRYICALVPSSAEAKVYVEAAQSLYSEICGEYLLSEKAYPHVSICHFQASTFDEAREFWKRMKSLVVGSFRQDARE